MKQLFKTTIVIWSEYDPEGQRELMDIARDATDGQSYCSRMTRDKIEDPSKDPDWDGTEFFGVEDKKRIKDTYLNGCCPDCGYEIPDNAQPEESCHNCGHVWYLERKTDDESEPKEEGDDHSDADGDTVG